MTKPLPAQTLPFTCGPACVAQALIATGKLDEVSLEYELDVWRRANTVFMGPGLPGCSPHGLALELVSRGLHVVLLRNSAGLFIEPIERARWKREIALGQQAIMERDFVAAGGIMGNTKVLKPLVRAHLDSGAQLIALCGAGTNGRGREPHWSLAWRPKGTDMVSVYDPFNETDDFVEIKKMSFDEFWSFTNYGRARERCYICISERKPPASPLDAGAG